MTALTMDRGTTRTITETIQPVDVNGHQVLGAGGIAGWKFTFTAKYDQGDPDSAAVVQKTSGAWTITTNGNASTPGVAVTTLAAGDTASLPAYQVVLSYDVRASDTSGNIYTVDEGTLTVTPGTTVTVS